MCASDYKKIVSNFKRKFSDIDATSRFYVERMLGEIMVDDYDITTQDYHEIIELFSRNG